VHNLPSSRVAIEAGFDFEGVKRCAGLHLDGWHDMHLHARINDTKLGMGNSVTEIHATTIDHSPAVTRLLALASAMTHTVCSTLFGPTAMIPPRASSSRSSTTTRPV